jgi:hypothetical protein
LDATSNASPCGGRSAGGRTFLRRNCVSVPAAGHQRRALGELPTAARSAISCAHSVRDRPLPQVTCARDPRCLSSCPHHPQPRLRHLHLHRVGGRCGNGERDEVNCVCVERHRPQRCQSRLPRRGAFVGRTSPSGTGSLAHEAGCTRIHAHNRCFERSWHHWHDFTRGDLSTTTSLSGISSV